MTDLPPVLDACCGPRFMWFDPKDGRALFMDRRRETVKGEWGPGSIGRRDLEINPDVLADFTDIPFPDELLERGAESARHPAGDGSFATRNHDGLFARGSLERAQSA